MSNKWTKKVTSEEVAGVISTINFSNHIPKPRQGSLTWVSGDQPACLDTNSAKYYPQTYRCSQYLQICLPGECQYSLLFLSRVTARLLNSPNLTKSYPQTQVPEGRCAHDFPKFPKPWLGRTILKIFCYYNFVIL